MPPPAAPRPEPDPPGAEPETPPRRFRHLRPVEVEAGEVTRHGHGSGCIPVVVFRLSILALLIYVACLAAGVFLARHAQQTRSAAPAAQAPHQAPHAGAAGGVSLRPPGRALSLRGAILEEGVRRLPAAPPATAAP